MLHSRGAFIRKSAEQATQLIEELAKSNHKAPSEASGSSSRFKAGGVIELNKMTAIEIKLYTIMNRMNSQERRSHLVNEVGIVNGLEQNNVADQGLAHGGPYQVEEVQYLNGNRSYNFKPNSNLPTPTHHLSGTIRIFLMEVEIINVKDQIRTINRITLHLDSKDKTKAIQGKIIKGREDHHPLKIKY